MRISDEIAAYILNMLESAEDGEAELGETNCRNARTKRAK